MDDAKLLRTTLERLELTYKTASGITGMSLMSLQRYAAGERAVSPKVWRGLLEYEARLDLRQRDIAERAMKLGAKQSPKVGRPRKILPDA